ncbi:MAG: homoserine dehydrogenase [Clostridia bacterium]
MAKIAVMGHGVVGSGVLEVLLSHKNNISKRAKEDIEVKYILDLREFPELTYSDLFIKDFNIILSDPEIKIVVEVMGGTNPAYDFVKACLLAGKSVVTSNKELVATKGSELIEIAQNNNLNFLFEASVGGGIPIIRPITQCLAANDVTEIAGILNGTTNFILTKMIREQMDFETALALAQELGYAERDPSADVNGDDACRKICILADLSYGYNVDPSLVYTKGITSITLEDVEYASSWGGVIKLIGSVKKTDIEQIQIMVSPMFVSRDSQLSSVDDVFNGIMVRGDATGDVVFYGKGAGKLPTASAVVADIIDCVKHFNARKYIFWDKDKENYVMDYKLAKYDFYLRTIGDCPYAKIEEIIPSYSKLSRKDEAENEFAFVLKNLNQNELNVIINKLEENGLKVLNFIPISDY